LSSESGKGATYCVSPQRYGSVGANGSAGTFAAGTAGSAGTYPGAHNGFTCPVSIGAGAGGAGGAQGFAARFGGRTVSVNNSGTVL